MLQPLGQAPLSTRGQGMVLAVPEAEGFLQVATMPLKSSL